MNKFKYFIINHLDQMIYIGGSSVIVCLVLKFMAVPGSDYIFSCSLLIEAFIFLLGVFRPSEANKLYCIRDNKNNYNNNFYPNNNIENNNLNDINKIIDELDNLLKFAYNIKNKINNSDVGSSYNENKNYYYNNFSVNGNLNLKNINDNFIKIYKKLDSIKYYLQAQSGSLAYSGNTFNNFNDSSNINNISCSSTNMNSLWNINDYDNLGGNYGGTYKDAVYLNDMNNCNVNTDNVKTFDGCIRGLHGDIDNLYMSIRSSSCNSNEGNSSSVSNVSTNVSNVSTNGSNVSTNGSGKKRRGRPSKKIDKV